MFDEKSEEQKQDSATPGEDKEAEGFSHFASVATRTQRRGIREQLLTQLLIKSNVQSDPLLKIEALTEAAYLSKSADKLDLAVIETCSVVCRSFINTEKDFHAPAHRPDLVIVSWAFQSTKENWEKYIKPWQHLTLTYYPLLTSYAAHNYPGFPLNNDGMSWDETKRWLKESEELCKAVMEWHEKLPDHSQFYGYTHACSRISFTSLKGEFAQWALSKLRPIEAVLAEEVNPEIYRDILELMRKERPSKETMEEEAA